MAKRKVSNLSALAVLSLLTERPMHPYEMLSVMRQRELTSIIKINQSSLYAVIEALQRKSLIAPSETQREGRYPERTVYTVTETGKIELIDWLRALLRQPVPEYTPFAASLAFIGHLSPVEASTLLQEHTHFLQEEITQAQSRIEHANKLGVDRLFTIEDLYALALLQTRQAFIQQLIAEIADDTLTELHNQQRIWKITRPDLTSLGGVE
jgi:DNA-binding PadR family transcriptional regulator